MFKTHVRTPVTLTYSVYRCLSKGRGKGNMYYAVGIGKKVGVYETWEECEAQIKGYPNARYQKFHTAEDADNFVQYWDNFIKISDIQLQSVKHGKCKESPEKECLKNVMAIASQMAHLKSDFKKVKEAIKSNSNSWYSKREKNVEEKILGKKTQNNFLGFVKLKKTEEPSEEPSRSYSTHEVAPSWKDQINKLLECRKQIDGMVDARFKKFYLFSDAQKYVEYWMSKKKDEEPSASLQQVVPEKPKKLKNQEEALNCLHLRFDEIENILSSLLRNSEEINRELSTIRSELNEMKKGMSNTSSDKQDSKSSHFISPSRF